MAVGAVVIFHIWPAALPGGYVGVDVFFVISGFLITGQLLAEATTSGRIRLGAFWARRIRRLLPAAVTVITVTLAASWFLLPRDSFRTIAEHAIGSVLYVENWVLSAAAVDYLDSENDATPFQHYWSLSVEEQFYVLWPLLVIAALLLARRMRTRGSPHTPLGAIGITLATVTLLSLLASVLLTPLSPAAAYFSTPLRAWEFGVGGLLAWGAHRGWRDRVPPRARAVTWWIGVGAVTAAALLFNSQTLFPGTAALLPVIGAGLALMGGLRAVPVTIPGGVAGQIAGHLGEWSYSLYLWHWPAVVIAVSLTGAPLGVETGIALLAGVIALSALSERWIERPVRRSPRFDRPRSSLAILVIGALIAAGPASLAIVRIDAERAAAEDDLDAIIDELGANAGSGHGSASRPFDPATDPALYPALVDRLDDTAGQYHCYLNQGEAFEPCGYGDPGAVVRLALVGDSHAASLVPALRTIVEDRGWRLDVLVGNACRLALDAPCAAHDDITRTVLDGGYTAVLATAVRDSQGSVADVLTAWAPFVNAGVRVVPIVDVPVFPESTDACLSRVTDAIDAATCWTPEDVAAAPDSYGTAGRQLGLPVIDLTDQFCRAGRCPAVIGNVIVYRDSPKSHITATFSRTLSAALAEQLVPLADRTG